MAAPRKFSVKKELKIVNRCLFCAKVIPMEKIICDDCRKKQDTILNKKSFKN